MKIKHFCSVEGGVLKFYNPVLWAKQLYAFNGKKGFITLDVEKKKRTNDQNSRHWARMYALSEITQDRTPEEWHYDLCRELLTDYTVTPPRRRTTKDLSTVQFSKFEEDTDMWLASNFGIVLPDPKDIVKD